MRTASEKEKKNVFDNARVLAVNGVTFNPKLGAICPWCGAKNLLIKQTMAPINGVQIRFHECETKSCRLASTKLSIKSIEKMDIPSQ